MQLRNTGDLAARFVWDAASLGQYFSIVPASGQVEAGRELALEVAFKPTCVLADMHTLEVRADPTSNGARAVLCHIPVDVLLSDTQMCHRCNSNCLPCTNSVHS